MRPFAKGAAARQSYSARWNQCSVYHKSLARDIMQRRKFISTAGIGAAATTARQDPAVPDAGAGSLLQSHQRSVQRDRRQEPEVQEGLRYLEALPVGTGAVVAHSGRWFRRLHGAHVRRRTGLSIDCLHDGKPQLDGASFLGNSPPRTLQTFNEYNAGVTLSKPNSACQSRCAKGGHEGLSLGG